MDEISDIENSDVEIDNVFSYLSDLICRVCLRNNEPLNSLDYEISDENYKDLRSILKRVASVNFTLKEEELTTSSICVRCTEKLLDAYEFICTVERAEQYLIEYVVELDNKPTASELNESLSPAVSREDINVDTIEEDVDEKEEDVIIYPDDPQLFDVDEIIVHEDNSIDVLFDKEQSVPVSASGNVLKDVEEQTTSVEEPPLKADERIDMNDKKLQDTPWGYLVGSRLASHCVQRWNKCSHCQRAFAKPESLQNHIKNAHTRVSAQELAAVAPKPTKEQPLQCQHCPRTFPRQSILNRHLKAAHADKLTPTDIPVKKYRSKRGLCPYCGESFAAASLNVHIRRHTGETPYKCDMCDKAYPRRQDLVTHKRQHTGEKPHICTTCGKTFGRPNKLTRHMRIHTGVRPYKCTECPKSFAQSNDLVIHLRRHTGEKPYVCNICSEGFISGTALKKHRTLTSHEEDSSQKVDRYARLRVNTRIFPPNKDGKKFNNR